MKVEQIWRHGPAKVDGVTGPGRTTGSAHLEVTVDESVRSAIVPVVSAIDLYRSLGHWLATNGLITAETIKHTPPGGASEAANRFRDNLELRLKRGEAELEEVRRQRDRWQAVTGVGLVARALSEVDGATDADPPASSLEPLERPRCGQPGPWTAATGGKTCELERGHSGMCMVSERRTAGACDDRRGDATCALPPGHSGPHQSAAKFEAGVSHWSDPVPTPRRDLALRLLVEAAPLWSKDVLSRLLDAVMDAAEERWEQRRFR